MKNNQKSIITLLSLLLLSTSFIACGDTGKNEDKTLAQKTVLQATYDEYVMANLTEAKEWAENFEKFSTEYCAKTTDADKEAYSAEDDGDTFKGKNTLTLAWKELNEYSTNRLRMFNYLDFQKASYGTINDTADKGLMSIAKVLFKGAPDVQLDDTACSKVKDSATFIKGEVEKLATQWNTNKNQLIEDKDGVKKLLMGISDVIATVDKDELADPAKLNLDGSDNSSATGDFRAKESKLSGWLASQSITRGPQALYVGKYKKGNWQAKSLQALVKSQKADLDASIVQDYKDFDAILGSGGSLIKKDISDAANKEDLKKAIIAADKLSKDFKAASELFK